MLEIQEKDIAVLNDQNAHRAPENPVRHLDKNLQTPEESFINDKNLVPHLDKNLQTPEKPFINDKNLVPHLDTHLQTPEKPFIRRTSSQLVELDFHKGIEEPFKTRLFNDNTQVFEEDLTKLLQIYKKATVQGAHEMVIKLAED